MAFWGIPKVKNVEGQEFWGNSRVSCLNYIYALQTCNKGFLAFGFVHDFVMLLHNMNKDESLFIASYAFVRRLQLYMSCLVTHDMLTS